jgi:segregation and condensation protein B
MSAKSQQPASDDSFGLEAFRKPPEDAGLSLNQLSAAFAEMLASGDDPYTAEQTADQDEAAQSKSGAAAAGDELLAASDSCEVTPRSILESMLFVGGAANEPLTAQQVAKLMRGVRPAEIDLLVRDLNADYDARRCPYTIVAAGAGYQLRLRDQFARLRDKFYGKVRQARLSQAAIEVLSVVAYHEPLSAEEVNQLRGTASGPILAQLVRRQLLRLERSGGRIGRGKYFTTPRFLELFSLASLDDLPRSNDLERY